MACDDCLSRRAFLAAAAGTAGALSLAALGACGDGDVSTALTPVPAQLPAQFSIDVADFAGLATAGVLVEVSTGNPVAAKRTGDASFEAFWMRCTHRGCPTGIVGGATFHCDCHGSNFGNDGSVINGPFTGDAITPLVTLPTSYDQGTGILTIG